MTNGDHKGRGLGTTTGYNSTNPDKSVVDVYDHGQNDIESRASRRDSTKGHSRLTSFAAATTLVEPDLGKPKATGDSATLKGILVGTCHSCGGRTGSRKNWMPREEFSKYRGDQDVDLFNDTSDEEDVDPRKDDRRGSGGSVGSEGRGHQRNKKETRSFENTDTDVQTGERTRTESREDKDG